MQKSKKMMVSLCGLALSSLFVINNKSVVHADTVNDNNQNSAISWDNDSDQAQGVQNADDDQQNAAQSMQSRAETSTVRSSSANRNTTVQDNTANTHATQDIKVANVDTAQPAVVKQSQADYSETLSNLGTNANLGDLGVYDVSPDGVKSNIQSQVQSQLAIDDASLANFNMNKDASGNLTASFGVYSNRAKQQNWWTNVKVNNVVVPGIQWRTNAGTASDGNLHLTSTGQPIVYSVGIHKLPGVVIHNPAGGKVNVHYVNSEGKDIADPVVKDTVVDVSKAGSGSYSVPNGYSLNDPDGQYTVSGGAISGTNLKGSVEHHDAVLGGHLSSSDFGDGARRFYGVGYQDGRVYVSADEGGEWLINMSQYNITYHSTDEFGNQYYVVGSSRYTPSTPGVRLNIPNNASPNGFRADITNLSVYGDNFYILVPHDQTKEIEPAYDEQHLPVAFVDANNNIVGMIKNYSGKVGTTQNVNLTLPTGYKLADGATLPTSVSFQNSTNPLLVKVVPSGKTQSITNPANNTIHVHFVDQQTGNAVGGDYDIDLTKAQDGTNYYTAPSSYGADVGSFTVTTDKKANQVVEFEFPYRGFGRTSKKVVIPDSDNILVGLRQEFSDFDLDHGTHITVSNFTKTDYEDSTPGVYGLGGMTSDGNADTPRITIKSTDNGWKGELAKFIETYNYRIGWHDQVGDGADLVWPSLLLTKQGITVTGRHFTDNLHTISGNTVTVPVHKTNSFSFADNSGNVKSVNGNNVNVTLTKPQSVNPAMDKRCQSQATRTIQINFPDGQIPKAYDGIVDKSGKLVQTVHFTRTATEDALTGNILQYGNWTSDNQDPNFIGFPERTLPRIPGYTLSIKPA